MTSYGSAERKPLNGSEEAYDSETRRSGCCGLPCSKSNLCLGALIVVLLVLYFGFPTANTVGITDIASGSSKVKAPETSTEEEAPGTTKIMYRPFCINHGSKETTVRLLQTSMQNPSQPWSTMPCYHASVEGAKQTDNYEFGAPDASFQVNFSQLAFERRETPILGFGGAFTEAAALNFHSLDRFGQEAVLELLFGETGLGYAQGRVHINSCDFSVKAYNFDETEDDFDLEDFDENVQHDVDSGMIDMALRATSKFKAAWASDDGWDGNLRLYASPWSPPSWMKKPTVDDSDDAGHAEYMFGSDVPTCIREGTGPNSRYAKAWALYFSKFLSAYERLGLPFFGVTPQNEPEFVAPWEACAQTPITESDFVGYHLGPQLQKDHPNVSIIGFDHNKDHINTWVNELVGTSPSAPYMSGTAYHWYAGGMNRLLDGALGAPNMHRTQALLDALGADPAHFLINMESCHCPYTGYGRGSMQDYWRRAERNVHAVLSDLAAGSNAWLEWNFILDSQGGPNKLHNLCDSSLLAVPYRAKTAPPDTPRLQKWDHTNGSALFGTNIGDSRTLPELNALGFPAKYLELGVVVQPMYYYMGHISRYVRPGSRAIMGLVGDAVSEDGSLTFRPKGQSVAGGGQNDLAQPDIEITMWPCEGSTRQLFQWVEATQSIQVKGHDWLGNTITSCVGNMPHKTFKGLTMASCEFKQDVQNNPGSFEIVQFENYTQFVLTNGHGRWSHDQCLELKELKNSGGAYGPRGGAQVSFGSCDSHKARFHFDKDNGEISSFFYADEHNDNKVCMTTGWPFLQMGAFDTPNGESKKTVVVLNEATEAANYRVIDNGTLILTGSIPPRAVQTILID